MTLLQLVIVLVVIGVGMWLVNSYIPMQRSIKTVLNVVVVIAVIMYVLMAFGLLGSFSGLRLNNL